MACSVEHPRPDAAKRHTHATHLHGGLQRRVVQKPQPAPASIACGKRKQRQAPQRTCMVACSTALWNTSSWRSATLGTPNLA